MAKKGGKRSGGGGGDKQRKYTRDNNGRFASTGTGATARGGRLLTAKGNKRKTQAITATGQKGVLAKPKGLKPGSIKPKAVAAAKPATRKDQLAAGAKKRTAQADRIDAKVKKLEGEYRGKDAAFYTQGVKPAGRDRMIAKSQQAAQLREQSAALRSKASNAEKMASKIKNKPTKSSGGNARLGRAIKNEAAGSTSYSRNPKGYQKRITALTAQQIYKTGDFMAGLSVAKAAGKGFRLPRNERAAAKPAAPKAAKPTSTKGARLGGTRRTTQAAAVANTAANRTKQSKTLNRFNSRPERTRGAYVGGRYVDKAKLTGRQALDLGRSDDQAFARTATKAARSRAAAPAKAQQKQTTAQRATRAAANQKRVTQAVLAKSSRRPTRKQRRSILTAESAKRFYATKAVDYLKVNVKKPGFRLPRSMR